MDSLVDTLIYYVGCFGVGYFGAHIVIAAYKKFKELKDQ